MRQIIPRKYYKSYETRGWDLRAQVDIISRMPDCLPASAIHPLRDRQAAHYLLLGSATPRNLGHMVALGGLLRPGQGKDDTITIVDSNRYAIGIHRKEINKIKEQQARSPAALPSNSPPLAFPQFALKKADICDTGLDAHSVDVVVSDYTFNFFSDTEGISSAFAETARVLKKDGAFLLAVCGHAYFPNHEEAPPVNPAPVVRRMAGATSYQFPLGTYLSMAREHGLELAAQPYIDGSNMNFSVLQPKDWNN